MSSWRGAGTISGGRLFQKSAILLDKEVVSWKVRGDLTGDS